MPDYTLIINGYTPPPCDKEGYTVTENKIWSKNTGRTASGLMVGDIIAKKYSVSVTWSNLDEETAGKIHSAISEKAFFDVTFLNQKGERLTKTFYSDDPVYTKKLYIGGKVYYASFTVILTEK